MTNDLISRKAAMKFTTPEDWGTPDEKWRPESEYGKFIEALPPAQQWIPCSERLPEESKAVLAWCPTFKNSYCVYRKNDAWWIFGAYRTALQEIVVAWMELPEPYKEAANDD